jgi:hypothetical protein
VPVPVVAVPGVDILLPAGVPDADVDVPVEAELPAGVITVPDGDTTFPDGVTTVPAPVTPVDGSVADGDTVPDVTGVTGGTVTGGTTTIGGAATRGVTTSLLSTQSGPLRSMQAGTASGTLMLRSVVSAAMAGAAAAENAMNSAATRFGFIDDVLLVGVSAAAGTGRNRARDSALAVEKGIAGSHVA